MPYPSEPNKIVFKNSIYPIGLTTGDIYSYYLRNKSKILEMVEKKKLILFMSFDVDKPLTVVRNLKDGSPIILNKSNYTNILSGYNISISMETPDPTDYIVLDIDYKDRATEMQMKRAASDVRNMFNNMSIVKESKITNSSTGYHIYGFLKRKIKLDDAREILLTNIKKNFSGKYGIGRNSKVSGVVLDITPMYKRGAITIPYSLTREGIKCEYINNLNKFNRSRQRIKYDQ